MVSALVLVNTNIGEENQTLEKLKKLEGVEEAQPLWGIYDLMVKVKANSVDSLKEIVQSHLRQAGANTHLTLMMMEKTV